MENWKGNGKCQLSPFYHVQSANYYKPFKRPQLEYVDTKCGQPSNEIFSSKINSVWYNAALENTGTIRGSSRKIFYQ